MAGWVQAGHRGWLGAQAGQLDSLQIGVPPSAVEVARSGIRQAARGVRDYAG
ncbi:hypothetical protein O7626_06175 [Micromonospora sp. WMMD1102]|uniref:hypothetical protein n=1 Tax=Micromonospora sp. WMMD1102 TaxID=3016105 RepID=UPI002414E1FB|nr:hypothetical protein [Micromonospora sp. WMMD1102]MDG4785522.1 hypothetical protein [Micromonospora sp. WMMD1102]